MLDAVDDVAGGGVGRGIGGQNEMKMSAARGAFRSSLAPFACDSNKG